MVSGEWLVGYWYMLVVVGGSQSYLVVVSNSYELVVSSLHWVVTS